MSILAWRLKRFAYQLQRLRGSFALRGWRGTFARIGQEFQRRPAVDNSLAPESLDIPFSPFTLPVSAQPLVSVIIPIHGKLAYTLACLRSIAHHRAEADFEVIVVDDASPDDSPATLARIDGLRMLCNEHNLGFVASCNAGAAIASGSYLLFLNNDTQVTPGWMDRLLDCFAERADCGIAGSRLVYPDGRLQEAGGLVFSDGNCWNVGRFEARDAPAYGYRRETDYVSGASLMITRDLFRRVGGFDVRYTPAYYEDADLAFAVRQAGLRVYYEPGSTVIHCEGISAGTDLSTGMKRYQAINQTKFAAKWTAALRDQPPAGTRLDRAVRWHRRGRILVVDSMTPEPNRDSGSLRLSEILRLLDAQGWSVSFAPDDGRANDAECRALGAFGIEVLHRPWLSSVPSWLARHGAELQAVILCRHAVAGQYADLVRRHAPRAKLLFDTVDLHFLREQRAAELTGNAGMARQAQAAQQSELAIVGQCDVTLVVSPYERGLLQQLAPGARIELLSNIHPVHGRRRPYAERRDLVFIGGYGHPPNSDAIRWIAGEILPRLREQLPDLQVHVLGDIPTEIRKQLACPGLHLHGRVPDLAPWLDSCLASLAPLRFGAGVKGKINMAMSYGVPVVATPIAVEGMQLTDKVDVLVAEDADRIVQAVVRLHRDESLWQALSEHGLDNVSRYFSVAVADATLRRILENGSSVDTNNAIT